MLTRKLTQLFIPMRIKELIELSDMIDEQWDDLEVRMLSLYLMKGVKKAFPNPFGRQTSQR